MRENDQLDVAALREIIAGKARPGSAGLVELTTLADVTPEESR